MKPRRAKPAPEPVPLPADMANVLWGTKDLARYMGISTRAVKRWWKRFRVPPDACAANSLHRWTPAAVVKLLAKWRAAWQAQGVAAEEATAKFSGRVKAEAERRQLKLKLTFR
jgi:hypothetical protein